MKIKAISVCSLGLALTMSFPAIGMNERSKTDHNGQNVGESHVAGFIARINSADGTTRTVKVQGVGCSAAICSKVFIRGRVDNQSETKVWLDSITAIKNVSKNAALFVLKDGTQQWLSFIPDFRVLYIALPKGGVEKLDLGTILSLDIFPSSK
jgi:hypothetical protein